VAVTPYTNIQTVRADVIFGRSKASDNRMRNTKKLLIIAAVLVVVGGALGGGLCLVLWIDPGAVAQSNLQSRSWGLVFPLIGIASLVGLVAAARARRDDLPVILTIVFFVAAYFTLAVMFWPHMIPYQVTVANAAAPDESLQFLSYCGIVVLPVIVIYTFSVYRVFRGKSRQQYN